LVSDPQDVLFREVQWRTRCRLTALAMRVRAYRWRHGRLPKTLHEAVGNSEIDPLTRAPFRYEVGESGRFRVFSDGTSATGSIEAFGVSSSEKPENPPDPVSVASK